ncbi:hypothetical protein ACQCSJ_14820, partial [Ralstonia pseudosolanacearum]
PAGRPRRGRAAGDRDRPDQPGAQLARHGIPAAMFMLANAYRDGDGVPRDEARALALYEQAAEHELPEAVQALAMAYQNGELGLARDDAAFRKQWLETAHALKHPALAP